MQSKTTLSITAVAIVIIVAGVVWLSAQNMSQEEVNKSAGTQIPAVSLTDYEGNEVSLGDFSDKPLVINSWAVWCPFCVDELPDFVMVQKEFEDQVTFIAIDRAEPRDAAKEFTDGLGITDDLVFLLDPRDSFYQAIGGFSMPETLFVNADGTIHFHKRGPMPVEEIRQRTQELIQQQ
ncbi:MAG: TlpA disulfide reductase family protein [Candidatus Andersenbacteria bacterium]